MNFGLEEASSSPERPVVENKCGHKVGENAVKGINPGSGHRNTRWR